KINNQTDFAVVYNERYVNPDIRISVSVEHASLPQLLETVLKPLSLDYHITEKTIVITALAKEQEDTQFIEPPLVKQRTVTGQVTDEMGNPLDGVTVTEKNTRQATTTDAQGNYGISVSGDGILVFTIVGFEPYEQALGTTNVVDVVLKASVSDLDEVVVVGYGTQKKINLTGAVSTMSSEDIENRPITNAT